MDGRARHQVQHPAKSRSRSRKRHSHNERDRGPLAIVLWAARALALLLLVAVPWNYGSVSWGHQFYLVLLASIVFLLSVVVALLRRQRPFFSLTWGLLAFLLLGSIQVVPLPTWAWEALAPRAAFERQVQESAKQFEGMLQEDMGSDSADRPRQEGPSEASSPSAKTLSISPLQTRASLAIFGAAIAFLVSSTILFATPRHAIVLLATLAITIFCHAALGLFQKVSWNDWTLLPMSGDIYFSTFVSRNSAPQYYAIGIGAVMSLLTWWLYTNSQVSTEKRYNLRYPAVNLLARIRRRLEDLVTDIDPVSIVGLCFATLILVAILSTASRGGVLACLGTIVITTVFMLGRDKTSLSYGLLAMLTGIAAVIMLTTLDLDEAVLARLDTVLTEVESERNPRYQVWRLAVSNSSYWLLGSGLGTFHFAILPAQQRQGGWPYHAESIYVETFTEFGVFGFLLMLATIYWMARLLRTKSPAKRVPATIATVFAVTAIGLQSFVDFSLIVPAIFFSVAALLGSFLGQQRMSERKSSSEGAEFPNSALATQSLTALGLTLVILQGLLPLYGYAQAEQVERQVNAQTTILNVDSSEVRFPDTRLQMARLRQANAEQLAADLPGWPTELLEVRSQLSAADQVSGALRSPEDAQLHALAELLRSEPQITRELTQSCNDSMAAVSACALDWRASWGVMRGDCGQLSPQQRAANYARLALLTNHYPKLQQRIGTVALGAGERQVGLEFWKNSLARNPSQATRIVGLVGSTISQAELKEVLSGRGLLLAHVGRKMSSRDMELAEQLVADLTPETLATTASNTEDWLVIDWVAERQSAVEWRIVALRRAAELSPLNHHVRYTLARLLEQQGNFSEAIRWMKQAVRRSQDNRRYRNYLETLEKRD